MLHRLLLALLLPLPWQRAELAAAFSLRPGASIVWLPGNDSAEPRPPDSSELLLLGGLFPLRYAGAGGCGDVNFGDGVQSLEAALFTLRRLRRRGFLGNASVGLLAIDTCQSVDHALSQSINFTNVLARSLVADGLISCPGSSPVVSDRLRLLMRVVGILGAADSDVSVAIASFMKHFRMPQISFMSTTPQLSNREKYPYFLRTVPSDRYTVQGIVDILSANQQHQEAINRRQHHQQQQQQLVFSSWCSHLSKPQQSEEAAEVEHSQQKLHKCDGN